MKGLIFISTSLFLQAFVLSSVSFSLDKVGVLSFSALSFLLCTIIFFLKVCSAQGLNLDQTKFKAILKLNLYTMLAFFPFPCCSFLSSSVRCLPHRSCYRYFCRFLYNKAKEDSFAAKLYNICFHNLFCFCRSSFFFPYPIWLSSCFNSWLWCCSGQYLFKPRLCGCSFNR